MIPERQQQLTEIGAIFGVEKVVWVSEKKERNSHGSGRVRGQSGAKGGRTSRGAAKGGAAERRATGETWKRAGEEREKRGKEGLGEEARLD